ncbi:MAG: FKBP-type peptidyl-prolyl cis-trans isomerase [Muribaculaceae bacterium]|nr:FKBP-type peptidyl-prolyl cis-trans isomerase [Muribaculaceae bacterium]
MVFKRLFPILTILALLSLPSCFKDNDNSSDYSAWRQLNQNYIDSIDVAMENGEYAFTRFTPLWDNSFSIWLRWHNEEENPSFVTPLSTSTCHVKYTLTSVAGDTLDSSAAFTCVPNQLVTGFMAALQNMRVNDTVTAVIPYTAGYGTYGYGNILPYTTLIFGIRLDSISNLF